jgi:hypothetical protein
MPPPFPILLFVAFLAPGAGAGPQDSPSRPSAEPDRQAATRAPGFLFDFPPAGGADPSRLLQNVPGASLAAGDPWIISVDPTVQFTQTASRPAVLPFDMRPPTEDELRRVRFLNFTEERRNGFAVKVASDFYDRFAPLEHRQFRAAVELSWRLPSRPGDPAREDMPTAAFDPIYRDLLLERRARSPVTGTATSALSETDLAQRLREQIQDDRGFISKGVRTLLGDSVATDDPFDVGRFGIRGYPANLRDPGDLLGLTYEAGPTQTRIGGATATASIVFDIPVSRRYETPFRERETKAGERGTDRGEFIFDRVFVGATYDYERNSANPRFQWTRPLGRNTAVHILGGLGVDSFLIPGNVVYLSDPRENTSVGIMLIFDMRF